MEYEQYSLGKNILSVADFTADTMDVVGASQGGDVYRHREGNMNTALSISAIISVVNNVKSVCENYPFAWDHHQWYASWFADDEFLDYYKISETRRLVSIATNASTQWAPICVIYGLPGDVLLRRLRGCIKVIFPVFIL